VPALVALLLGVAIGYAAGGSLSALSQLQFKLEWMLLAGFVVQGAARGRLLGVFGASRMALVFWVLASVGLVIVLGVNHRIPGMMLAAFGVLLNLDIVLLHRGMPLVIGNGSGGALAGDAASAVTGYGQFYTLAHQAGFLVPLGDSIPLRIGDALLFVSPGDVVLLAAVVTVLVWGMAGPSAAAGVSAGAREIGDRGVAVGSAGGLQ
jgi:hypothetical protein